MKAINVSQKNRVNTTQATISENMVYFSELNRMYSNNGFYSNNFWQSASWNMRSFMMYRDWLRGIAISRVKWVNLPETCNERYLEWTLLNQGVACIARPKRVQHGEFQKDKFYSTQVAYTSPPNIYDDYTEFISIGNNGWVFESDIENGVLVWNNMERLPILSQIDLFARRLAWFDRVIDSNCKNQMNPIFITGDQRQAQTMIQLTKQIAGGEPFIVGTPEMSKTEIKPLNLSVPFISENVEMVKEQLMSQFYTFIGVNNTPRKGERMIEEEVAGYREPVTMNRLNTLKPRRDACKYLNDKFGLNIEVYWNDDVETTNYYLEEDLSKQADKDLIDSLESKSIINE